MEESCRPAYAHHAGREGEEDEEKDRKEEMREEALKAKEGVIKDTETSIHPTRSFLSLPPSLPRHLPHYSSDSSKSRGTSALAGLSENFSRCTDGSISQGEFDRHDRCVVVRCGKREGGREG